MNHKHFGEAMRRERGARTISDVARAAGISRHAIMRMERGDETRLSTFEAVCDALGMDRSLRAVMLSLVERKGRA